MNISNWLEKLGTEALVSALCVCISGRCVGEERSDWPGGGGGGEERERESDKCRTVMSH